MTVLLGIDPGLNGGIAVVNGNCVLAVIDIPTHGVKSKRRVDVFQFLRFIKKWQPQAAFIERAGSRPGQGSSSGFSYGRAVGALEAVVSCAGVPLTVVEPAKWKRKLGLPGGDKAKEAARQRAIQLFPTCNDFERKKDHGRAEAALIAYYGAGS